MKPWEEDLNRRTGLVPPFRMLTLGSKEYNTYVKPYEDRGCTCVGIDLDGRERCLPLDLMTEITPESLGGKFQLVTNFGTTEHVFEQEPCWRNIHSWIERGGFFVSTTPAPGKMLKHGVWYPSEEFFRKFAQLNGYEIVHMGYENEGIAKNLICVAMKKLMDFPFTMPDGEMHAGGGGDKLPAEISRTAPKAAK